MILQRYILGQLLRVFALAFAVLLFVALVGMLLQSLENYAGLGMSVVLRTVPVAVAYMAPWALVIAACAAATIVYGRLAEENEIDAALACGLHPARVVAPALLFGLLLAALSAWIHEVATPRAHYRKRVMIRESLLFLLQSPPPGNNSFKLGAKYTLSYTHFEGGLMEQPYLVESLGNGVTRESTAASGQFVFNESEPPTVVLMNGEMTEYTPHDHRRISGDGDVRVTLHDDFFTRPKNPPDMSPGELLACARENPWRAGWARTEFHARIARCVAPILLALICMSLGIFVRKGNRVAGFGAALPVFIVYMVLVMTCEQSGAHGKLSPLIAAWLSDGVLAAIAFPLLFVVCRR